MDRHRGESPDGGTFSLLHGWFGSTVEDGFVCSTTLVVAVAADYRHCRYCCGRRYY